LIRALAALLLLSSVAQADFVRGAIKIDVRHANGKPAESTVHVRGPDPDTGERPVTRAGEVYVASGLVDGLYAVSIDGGWQATVRVRGRLDSGVVFVVDGQPHTMFVNPDGAGCDAADGALVEAVVFARGGGLGAGRIDVRKHGSNKLVCSAIAAGGAATLRLLPGDYVVTARTVGGGSALERYELKRDRQPPPLALRAR
jgi:hypothetical protein